MLRRTRSSEGITGNRYYPLLPFPPSKARPFDGFERPPQFCIREPRPSISSPLYLVPWQSCFIVDNCCKIGKSINDQFSDRKYISRSNCETLQRSISRTYISQTLRGVKETSLCWRATKKNISGRSVHVQLLRRRGIWMNTFSPK